MKYPKCRLGHILNPGQYYILSNDKEHQSEVKILEELMTKEMNEMNVAEEFHLTHQMCVAARDSNCVNLKRGVIERKINDNLYEIFLIDYGVSVTTRKKHIKIITNQDFMKTEPLAFMVKLYGILPSQRCSAAGVKKIIDTMEWGSEANLFVQAIFKDKPKILVKIILLKERTVYGDLYLKRVPNTSYVSLRKLLYQNNMCAFSESYYLRHEGLSVTGESLMPEDKMELVKNWQKNNFSSALSSDNSVSNVGEASPPTVSPVCDVLLRKNLPQDMKGNSAGNSVPLGKGRGNLKTLMTKKVTVKTENAPGLSHMVEKSFKFEPKKLGFGRGAFKRRHEGSFAISVSLTPNSNSLSSASKSSDGILSDVDLKSEECCTKKYNYGLTDEQFVLDESKSAGASCVRRASTGKDYDLHVPHVESESENDTKKTHSTNSGQAKFPNHNNLTIQIKRERRQKLAATSDFWVPFVIFSDSLVEPVRSFRELPIRSSIILNLEKGGSFNNLSQVQRWAIPAIRKQHNTVIIGSQKTGKTLSYVIPLMDYVQDETLFDELPEGNGPFVVIVASSCHVCESIYHLCQSLLGHYDKKNSVNKVKINLAHGGGCEKEVWVDLTNGCDVLITTPHCLVRLLEMPVLTNFERLTCLVLEEIDVISQKPFLNSVRIIMEKARFSTKTRCYQKIFCGEKWTPGVESLVQTYVKSHALIIGSYMEAVVYDGLRPNIILVEREKKRQLLIEKIKAKLGKAKTIVFCDNSSEAISLDDFAGEVGISSVVAHEDMLADELRAIGSSWNESHTQWVLIVTDEVLGELNVKEAQALIHYSLPLKSKTNFYLRYSALQKHLKENCTCREAQGKKKRLTLSDTILIDDENHYQLPHIVDFVTRLGVKLPSKITKKCEEIRRQIEIGKSDFPVCRNVLALGRCKKYRDCSGRHAFVKVLDASDNLPTKGWVNFNVVKVHDASCFSVRLTDHVDFDGNVTKMVDESLDIQRRLSEYYKSEANRRPHGVPNIGDICAVGTEALEQELFLRVQVVEYLKLDKYGKPVEVRVRFMDEGGLQKRKNMDLYELPEELARFSPTAVDARLVGVQPLDFDVSWNQVANKFIENLMTRKLKENQYWSGKIVLTLNGTLFLDPVRRKEFLPALNIHVFDLVVQEELVNAQMAVSNREHLPSLLKLCAEAHMELPKKEVKKEDRTKIQPQWAFFDGEFLRVRFLAAEHTSRIFLQPKKLESLLEDLEAMCQKEGEKTAQEIKARRSKSLPLQSLSVGTFCLARFEDGRWNRARIEEVHGNRFYVFFVDHGDFVFVPKGDAVPISQGLLLRLPCQAVECRLVGIKIEGECSMEVVQEIYGFSDDGKEDLYAHVAGKDIKPEITNGRKYSVNLLNDRGISLNKWLVEEEMAPAEDSERSFLEDIQIEVSGEEEEEEDEEKEEEEEEDEEKEEEEEEEWKSFSSKAGEEKEEASQGVCQGTESDNVVALPSDGSEQYLTNLTDDVFGDENAQEFLKVFAGKFFKSLQTFEESGQKNKKEIEKELHPKRKDEEGNSGKQTTPEKKERLAERRAKLELKNREGVLTPQVLWSQNQLEVQLKIMLGNVVDYALECTPSNVAFRCIVGEKFYSVDLKLCGGINPQLTSLVPKTFYVVVTLTKLASLLWPRLQRDNGKFWWIGLDVESLVDKEEPFEDRIESAKCAIASGRTKKATRSEDILHVDSENSDDLCDSDSEYSEDNY